MWPAEVIADVLTKNPLGVTVIDDDDVIETIATSRECPSVFRKMQEQATSAHIRRQLEHLVPQAVTRLRKSAMHGAECRSPDQEL